MKKRICRSWTEEEDAYLRENWDKQTYEKIAIHLNRTEDSVKIRANRMGFRKQHRMTEEGRKLIDKLFLSMKTSELAEKVGVSMKAVFDYVKRSGLERKVKVYLNDRGQKITHTNGALGIYWSKQMDDDLRRMFPVMSNVDIGEHLGVSQKTVYRRARVLGLQKSPEYLRARSQKGARATKLHNITHGNRGWIKPGEHRSVATEFGNRKIV